MHACAVKHFVKFQSDQTRDDVKQARDDVEQAKDDVERLIKRFFEP